MQKKTLFILHFNPIEVYPPVINTIRYLTQQRPEHHLRVFTTAQAYHLMPFRATESQIKVIRCPGVNRRESAIIRLGKYLVYQWVCLAYLVLKRPASVLYYESLSAFPALVYKAIIHRQAHILVHYHEYASPTEYRQGMWLVRFFHRFEKKMYPLFRWISHTNSIRLRKFEADHASIPFGRLAVLPNYPPESWRSKPVAKPQSVLRIVYVGSLSLETMYLRAFCDWVQAQAGSVQLDLYAYNLTEGAKQYLRTLPAVCIQLMGGVEYDILSTILCNYHVGVVLYKGVSDNHIYSEPNKIFEYLACGLDVWFPIQITSSLDLITHGTYPQVQPIDFERLSEWNWKSAISREGLTELVPDYYGERVLGQLLPYL